MEQTRTVFYQSSAELKELERALDNRSPNVSGFSEVRSFLPRINVWVTSVGLTTSTEMQTTSYLLSCSPSITAYINSLLEDLTELCIDESLIRHSSEHEESADRELSNYFTPEDQLSKPGGARNYELSTILTHIEEIIDCLISLTPSIRNSIRNNRFIDTASPIGGSPRGISRSEDLVRKYCPAVDDVILARIVKSLCWRESRYSRKAHENWAGSLDTLTSEPCPLCGDFVTRGLRMEHISNDLRPYICLQTDCVNPRNFFKSHKDWIFHMKQEHWSIWACPLCPCGIFGASQELKDHISIQHTNQISPERVESFVRLCSLNGLDRVGGKCPFCSDFETQTPEQYQGHVIDHLDKVACSVFAEILGHENEDIGGKFSEAKDSSFPSREQLNDIETSSTTLLEGVAGSTAISRVAHKRSRSVSIETDSSEPIAGTITTKRLAFDTTDSITDGTVERQQLFLGNMSHQSGTPSSTLLVPHARQDSTPEMRAAASSSVGAESMGSTVVHREMPPAQSSQGPVHETPQSDRQGHRQQVQSFSGGHKGRVVYLWTCCYCGHSGMNATTVPACNSCGTARCGNCHVEACKVRS